MFKVVPPDVTGPAAFGYPGETDPRVTDGIDRWVRGLITERSLIGTGHCSLIGIAERSDWRSSCSSCVAPIAAVSNLAVRLTSDC